MSRFNRLLAAAGVGAMLATAISLPAAAIETPSEPKPVAHVTVVQGIPGEVDICVGGKEIASDVKFGRWASRSVDVPRVYKLRVYRPDPRTCGGTKLIQRKVELWPGRDVSLVLKVGQPRVVTFDVGVTPVASPAAVRSDSSPVILRHAARARDVEMRIGYQFPTPPSGLSAADAGPVKGLWNAGDEAIFKFPPEFDVMVGAKRDGQRIVRTKRLPTIDGKVQEVYLVGWNKDTYRWVVVRRSLDDYLVR